MASVKSVTIYDDIAVGVLRQRRYEVTITTNQLVDEVYILDPITVSASDDGTAAAAAKLVSLADNELATTLSLVAKYQDQNDYDRRALGKAMTIRSMCQFVPYYPLFQAMEGRPGNNNANARAAYLGVTRPTYDLITARFNPMAGVTGSATSDAALVWEDIPAEWL